MNNNNNNNSNDGFNNKNKNNKRYLEDNKNNDTISSTLQDENNNSNNMTFKRFKQDIDFDQIKYKQLQDIAVSLNLQKNGKKKELYIRIENHLKLELNTINEEKEKESINSFNKLPPQLLILDIEPLERMFWSIFRNKFIFNKIFSNFKFKHCRSYEDLIGVNYIFNKFTNSQQIIVDKLKSNNYIFINKLDIFNIFSIFNKDTSENRELYQTLFLKYPPTSLNSFLPISSSSSFLSLSSTSTSTSLQQENNSWLNSIVVNNNIFAFKQFINHLDINNNNNSNILNYDSVNIHNNVYNSSNSIKLYNPYKINKMMKYLRDNNYIDDSKISFQNFNNNILINYKLKQIIKLYHNVIHLFYNNFNYEEYNNINKQSYKYNQLIETLNQITLNHFTKDQLNSKIRNLIINSSSEIITISPNNSFKMVELLQNYYKVLYSLHSNYRRLNKKSYNIKPIQYYFYFSSKEKALKKYTLEINAYEIDIVQVTLRDSKKDQIEFILRFFNSNYYNIRSINQKYGPFIFKTCDLELIDTYIKKVHISYISRPSMFKYIKDTKQLDYYFKNYKEELFSNLNDYWIYISSLPILQHYETLMASCSRHFLISSVYDAVGRLVVPLDILIRALSNPSLYINRLKTSHADLPLMFNHGYSTFPNKEEDLIKLFSTLKFNKYSLSEMSLINFPRLYDWMFKDFSKELLIKYLMENKNKSHFYNLELSYSNNDQEIIKNNDNNNSNISYNNNNISLDSESSIIYSVKNFDLIRIIAYAGRIDDIIECFKLAPELLNDDHLLIFETSPIRSFSIYSLEKFILFCLSDLNSTTINLLYFSLCVAARKGYLPIFKRLISNNPQVLKIRTDKSNSLFDAALLKELIHDAIQGSNNYLANILIDYIGLSGSVTKKLRAINNNNHS